MNCNTALTHRTATLPPDSTTRVYSTSFSARFIINCLRANSHQLSFTGSNDVGDSVLNTFGLAKKSCVSKSVSKFLVTF